MGRRHNRKRQAAELKRVKIDSLDKWFKNIEKTIQEILDNKTERAKNFNEKNRIVS